jgi:hypothetical protein
VNEGPAATGAVASALQALRYNPMIVGVLMLNVLFFAGSIWYMAHTEDKRHEAIKLILERCIPAQK